VQEPIAAALAQKEIVNINTLIQTAILAVKSTRSEEVNWQVSFGAGNCIRCTREQIIQIFINILRNAYDALPENRGRIVVNAAQAKRETEDEFKSDRIVRITIIDDGEGFDASLHQEAFKDGFTTRRGQDRGHGLAVVRQLLALNDGEIEIVSPVSKDPTRRGTSVRLTFPRVRCQDDAGGAAT